MENRMKKIILALAFCLAISSVARAEIMVASSVEWLSCESEVIVVGKITDITTTKGVHSVIYEDCTVHIHEVLKGDSKAKDLVFCLRTLSAKPSAKAFMNSKDGILLFLSKSRDHGPERHLDNKYVPSSMRSPLSILDLSDIPNHVYSKDMRILTDKKRILNLVRTWSDSTISHSLWSEAPFGSPIYKQLYAGSACYLVVPAEETYRAQFLKMARSQKPQERQKAASELHKFPGEETTRVLAELLKDDTTNLWYFSADTVSKIEFGVRAAAYRSLKALGEPVPEKIQLERKPTETEQRSLRQSYWRKSFTEALPEGWKVISVEDGHTRQVGRRDATSVIVTCGKGESSCRLMLIPKEWDKNDLPTGATLGINGRNNQGARHFCFTGAMPEAVKAQVAKYFGLERL